MPLAISHFLEQVKGQLEENVMHMRDMCQMEHENSNRIEEIANMMKLILKDQNRVK